MGAEQFNDEQLLNLARYNFYTVSNEVSSEAKNKVRELLEKESLTNTERNFLVMFCATSKTSRPKSMRQMKNEILQMVGAPVSESYSNVMSATEVKYVYDWFCENFKRPADKK